MPQIIFEIRDGVIVVTPNDLRNALASFGLVWRQAGRQLIINEGPPQPISENQIIPIGVPRSVHNNLN